MALTWSTETSTAWTMSYVTLSSVTKTVAGALASSVAALGLAEVENDVDVTEALGKAFDQVPQVRPGDRPHAFSPALEFDPAAKALVQPTRMVTNIRKSPNHG
jgi:hypothetical protein